MHHSSRLAITAHFAVRMRQRGYRLGDYETVQTLGTQVRDGIVLLKRDAEDELRRLAEDLLNIRGQRTGNLRSAEVASERDIVRQMERLSKLVGTFIPTAGGSALSIYRPCNRRRKHILRGRRASGRRPRRRYR
jgi:hypothetical protein